MTRKTADGAWIWLWDLRLSVRCEHAQYFTLIGLSAVKGAVRNTEMCLEIV